MLTVVYFFPLNTATVVKLNACISLKSIALLFFMKAFVKTEKQTAVTIKGTCKENKNACISKKG